MNTRERWVIEAFSWLLEKKLQMVIVPVVYGKMKWEWARKVLSPGTCDSGGRDTIMNSDEIEVLITYRLEQAQNDFDVPFHMMIIPSTAFMCNPLPIGH